MKFEYFPYWDKACEVMVHLALAVCCRLHAMHAGSAVCPPPVFSARRPLHPARRLLPLVLSLHCLQAGMRTSPPFARPAQHAPHALCTFPMPSLHAAPAVSRRLHAFACTS